MPRLLIRGGRVIDGTGGPAVRCDVLVEDGRIAALIPAAPGSGPSPAADQVIDASGHVVCPGFIDIHSHGDLVMALPPVPQRRLLEGRLSQGITTAIVGNCGLGVYPRTQLSEPILRDVLAWMTPRREAGEDPEPGWSWDDLGSYLDHLESNGVWINVGALQPHGPLRIETAGLSPSPAGTAAREAVSAMSRRLDEALEAGAFGLSLGLIYPPGIFTPTQEIIDLARTVERRCGADAFVASHIRGSSETLIPAVEELLQVARESGARVQHSHSEAVGRDHWDKIARVIEMEDRARGDGLNVAHDMFPYTAAATMMLAIYPPWAVQGGVPRLLERLADPAERAAIGEAIDTIAPSWPPWTPGGWPHNLVKAVGWDRITIGSVGHPGHGDLEGMSLAELGRARGRTPYDAISDLMIEQRGMVSQIIHGVSGDEAHEEGIESLLSHPAGVVCTDADDFGKGRPHPAAWGTCPRVLGRYVRERKILSLERAIHKMTGAPAALLHLGDRGVLKAGACADIVIFDPGNVGSQASFAQPRQAAAGIAWVIVNGSIAVGREPGPAASPSAPRPAGRVIRRAS